MNDHDIVRARGSCICQSVRYEVRGPMRDIIACHCVECRKFSGHHLAATATRPPDLALIEDRGLRWYRTSDRAQRGFCGECGSTLFWKPDSGDRISIFAGSLDESPPLPLVAHIFVREKGGYYEIEQRDGVGVHPGSIADLDLG